MARSFDELVAASEACFSEKNWEQGLSVAQEMVAGFPDRAESYNQRGLYLLSLGRYPDAERSFTQALGLDFKLLDAHFNIAMLHAQRGRHDRALPHFKEVLLSQPNDAETLAAAASSALACGMRSEAEIFLRESLHARPDWQAIVTALAQLLIEDERLDDARVVLQRYVDDHADAPPPMHMALGLLHENAGSFAFALKHYHAVVTADDQNAEAFYHLGLCADEADLPNEAATFMSRAIHLKPNFMAAILSLGRHHVRRQQWDDARAALVEWQRLADRPADDPDGGRGRVDADARADAAGLLSQCERERGLPASPLVKDPAAPAATPRRVSLSIND